MDEHGDLLFNEPTQVSPRDNLPSSGKDLQREKGPQGLSMLPSIFTAFQGVSSSPTASPIDDVERIQIMITNIEQQQMAVRTNMISLIDRRQKALEKEIEQLMDEDEESTEAGKALEGREMLFKASVSAIVPKDHEIGKDDLVKGENVAKYEEYEVKIEDLSDVKIPPRSLEPLMQRNRRGDADGDVEMGGMHLTSRSLEPYTRRTRKELGVETMDLIEKGIQELEEFDALAKQELIRLKGWLEKKRGSGDEKRTGDVETEKLKPGMPISKSQPASRGPISFTKMVRRG